MHWIREYKNTFLKIPGDDKAFNLFMNRLYMINTRKQTSFNITNQAKNIKRHCMECGNKQWDVVK